MEEPAQVADIPQFSFKKRNTKPKSTLRKRPATPPPTTNTATSNHTADNDDSASDSSFQSSEDEEGRKIKRRKRNVGVTASSTAQRPAAGRESGPAQPSPTSAAASGVASQKHNDATKSATWYDEVDFTSNSNSNLASLAPKPTTGTYILPSTLASTKPSQPSSQLPSVGPHKSSSNVRTITTTDFAPDVCKDYKQTGFCGFGDSCKFLHAREDYKQGWALDRDWEIKANGKGGRDGKGKPAQGAQAKKMGDGNWGAKKTGNTSAGGEEQDEEKVLESIPFACIICKSAYTSPVVTKCGHYFCEACALQRYRKDPSCAACGSGTGGVFNVAKKLAGLLERKRQREVELKAEEEGERKGE